MKLFIHSRRAEVSERLYFVLFELLIIAVVAGIIANKMNTVRNDQVFEKKFFPRDLVLVLNNAMAAPGVLLYAYGRQSPSFANFSTSFDNQYVSVSGAQYPYAADSGVKVRSDAAVIDHAKSIALVRSGSALRVATQGVINPLRLQCGPHQAIDGKITLDAGRGWSALIASQGQPAGDQGIVTSFAVESETMRQLAAAVYGHDISRYSTTRDIQLDSPITLDERIKKIDAAVVSLHASTEPKIRAFVNVRGAAKDASIQLACELVNAMTDAFPATYRGASIIPIDDTVLAQDDARRVLVRGKPGVFLEIGDMNDPAAPLLNGTRALGDALHGALSGAQVAP